MPTLDEQIQQTDNTRVAKTPVPTGSYTHYDPKAPKTEVTQDTGTITKDTSNPIRRAIQNYTASYLNSNFANSPFMDVMRWLPGLSYMEKVVTGQPVGENESLSMVMPMKTPNTSNPYAPYKSEYFPNGKFDIKLMLEDIENGKQDAISFLQSDIKKASDAHNFELAQRIGKTKFRGYTKGSAARASKNMMKNSVVVPKNGSHWMGDSNNGYWLTTDLVEGDNLGKIYRVKTDPEKDVMILSAQGNPNNSMYHETLHRGMYGEAPFIPVNTKELQEAINQTQDFYDWKTKMLLKSNSSKYLNKSNEAAANAMEIGRELGIAPGTKYPGKQEALRIFSDAENLGSHKLDFLKEYNWELKPKRVWDAITGKYYILPAIGVAGITSSNTNNDTSGKSE